MSSTNLILVVSHNQLKIAQSSILGDEAKDEFKKILDFVQKISNDKLVMKQFQSQLNKCQFIQDRKMKFSIQKNELNKLLFELKSNNPIFANKELIPRLTKELCNIEPSHDSTFVKYIANHQQIEEDIATLGKHDYATMELKVIIDAYKDILEQNYILSDICGANIFEQVLSSKLDTIYLENNSHLNDNLFVYLIDFDKQQIEIYYQYTKNKAPEDTQPSIFKFVQKSTDLDVKLLKFLDFANIANKNIVQLVNDLYKLIC